jgi:hypothetical protein
MNLEQQVCSLVLAKRLKELGVKQESAFAWRVIRGTAETGDWAIYGTGTSVEEWVSEYRIAAFTAAELGEMLPNTEDCISRREPNDEEWRCGNQIEGTEANARAALLTYLIENGLITI